MALSINIEGKGSIAIADTSTETWGTSGGGGFGSASDEVDHYLQGTEAVSVKAASKDGWLYFDIGSGNELDFTGGGSEEGELIYIWFDCLTVGLIDTVANGGLRLQVGSTTSDYDYWTMYGNDTQDKYAGGWSCFVLDPSTSATSSGGSGLTKSSCRYFGIYINMSGGAKYENLVIDQISVGKGLRITGTETTSGDGWEEVADYCSDFANRAWGQLQQKDGIYYVYGHLYVGDSTQSTTTTLTDSGRVIKFGSQQYYSSGWVDSIPAGLLGLTIEDHASYTTTFQDGVVVGSDKGRSGSLFLGSDLHDCVIDLYGGNNSSSITKLYGTTFRGIQDGITWGNDTGHKCYSATFDNCGQFDPAGAVEIRNSIFSGYTLDADSALLWNSNIDIEDCVFAGNTDGTNNPHAIEHPTSGSFDYTNMIFAGNDYDINFSAGSGTLTINKLGTSNSSSYEITSGGTSVAFVASKNVNIHVEDVNGVSIEDAVVYLQRASATNYTADSGNSAGDSTFVVNEVVDTDQPASGWVRVWRKSDNSVASFRYTSWATKTFTLMAEVTGSVTTSGAGGEENTQLIDSAADFGGTEDVLAGDAIRNTSDGSWALIDQVISSTELKTLPLQDGGGNKEWDSSDNYSIHRLPITFVDNDDLVDLPLALRETDGSGDIATYAHNYAAGDMNIVVRIRQNEGGTKYIPYNTAGIITSSGYILTAVLQEDEVAT